MSERCERETWCTGERDHEGSCFTPERPDRECECNWHLGMGPNLLCPVHGRDAPRERRSGERRKTDSGPPDVLVISQQGLPHVVAGHGRRWRTDRRRSPEDAESVRCRCEWLHPVDGSVDARWPAELDSACPVHATEDVRGADVGEATSEREWNIVVEACCREAARMQVLAEDYVKHSLTETERKQLREEAAILLVYIHRNARSPSAGGEPCRIYEYDGAYRCTTHDRLWGAVKDPDEPCEPRYTLDEVERRRWMEALAAAVCEGELTVSQEAEVLAWVNGYTGERRVLDDGYYAAAMLRMRSLRSGAATTETGESE